ncbi:hypothetical protein J4456_04810 [Candidatus Pacearchaeota archaeon]|nr:hypothetical protein [Candidatus Pacearchaeota archaeon]
MDTLKIEDLEGKIQRLSQQVIKQFNRWPDRVPDSITLYDDEVPILEKFKTIFGNSLQSNGYDMPIIIGNEEKGYSISV